MWQKLFQLFIFSNLCNVIAAHAGTPEHRANAVAIDIDTLIDAIGLPQCVKTCIDPLIVELHKALAMEDTIDNRPALCAVFVNASSCIDAANCHGAARIYRIATTGIENLCHTKERFFQRQNACLKKHIDDKANFCDLKCNMVNSIAELSKNKEVKFFAASGGRMAPMLAMIGDICEAAKCFLPCFRDSMNAVCARSGGMIVDGLLRPFHYLAAFIDESGPVVQDVLHRNMPRVCKFLTNETVLKEIRKGFIKAVP